LQGNGKKTKHCLTPASSTHCSAQLLESRQLEVEELQVQLSTASQLMEAGRTAGSMALDEMRGKLQAASDFQVQRLQRELQVGLCDEKQGDMARSAAEQETWARMIRETSSFGLFAMD
jgi:hypothetical protein